MSAEPLLVTTAAGRTVRVIRADPRIDGVWSEVVGELSDSRLAHSPEWFTVIRRAYGHEPLYLRAEDEEGGGGLLPAFIVRRPLLGTVITSMPFLDGGGPCSSSPALAHALIERLMDEARREGAETVELRCTERLRLAWQPTESKVNLMLPIPGEADRLWRQFDGSVRNQIRKAERSGLSVEFGGPDKLASFYETFAERMRDLGSPVHSERFLRTVLESCGGRARIALISKGRTIVGGLIALAFKDRLVAPWAACLKDYRSLCPNMLLYWATLRTACCEGFSRFDFGRSSRGSGTYRFKRQWGALEEPLFWYTIPVAPGRRPHGPPENSKAADLAVKVWQRLPLSITRQLGPRVRKYLIQ